MFIARKSNHIESDIQRGWSSWNFGEEGLNISLDDLLTHVENMTEEDVLYISGFELYGAEAKNSEFGELYPGYCVLIDRTNGSGLAGIKLSASTLDEAIAEANGRSDYFGDGVFFSSDSELVYSQGEIHIFEV